jgi:hypothetical protein
VRVRPAQLFFMVFRAILVTLALTAAAVVLVVVKLGPGGPLLLPALGGSVVWLLPGALAVATPAGGFGGILLTRTRQGEITDEGWVDDTARLAVLALLLSALTVGWLVPLASHEIDGALSRLRTDIPAVDQREVKVEKLTLDQLFVDLDSVPGVRHELLRRAAWIALSFLLSLAAGALGKRRSGWTQGEAATATVMVFMISARLGMGN